MSGVQNVDRIDIGGETDSVSITDRYRNVTTRAHAPGLVRVAAYSGPYEITRASDGFVFDPSAWVQWAGTTAQNGVNRDPAMTATAADAVVVAGDHLVVWREANLTATQIRAAIFDPDTTTWTWLDGGGANGINFDPAGSAERPRLAVVDGGVYATWTERNPGTSRYQVRVARWNGSTTSPAWTFVDGNQANGLNRDPAQDADAPVLAEVLDDLYLAFYEADSFGIWQIRVRRFAVGTSTWTWLDGGGANGRNFNPAEPAWQPEVCGQSTALVLTWTENSGGVQHVRLAAYDVFDSEWTWLDGGTSNGLNVDPTRDAYASTVCGYQQFYSRVMVAWVEVNGQGVATVRASSGTTTGSFYSITPTTSLNFDDTRPASSPHLVALGARPYLAFGETIANRKQLRVAALGSSTNEFPGNATSPLNQDSALDARAGRLYSSGYQVFAVWAEENSSGVYQIRIAKTQ